LEVLVTNLGGLAVMGGAFAGRELPGVDYPI
jgi:hypothetical protein